MLYKYICISCVDNMGLRQKEGTMKYIVILGDGMSDEPLEALGGMTPMEYTETPVMDSLASKALDHPQLVHYVYQPDILLPALNLSDNPAQYPLKIP